MDDRTGEYIVYKKNEIQKFYNQIQDLKHENEKLKQIQRRYQELEFENLTLKSKLSERGSLDQGLVAHKAHHHTNGSDRHQVMEFMHTQEAPDVIPRVAVTPTNSHVTDSYTSRWNTTAMTTDPNDTTGAVSTDINESPNDGLNIGYGMGLRRPSLFAIPNQKHRQSTASANLGDFQRKPLDTAFWSIPDNPLTTSAYIANGLAEMAKPMRAYGDRGNHTIIHKILVREWNRKPEPMARTEFFYHVLHVFVTNGVLITTCAEHQPPCRPRVDTKCFEANAPALKGFVQCINGHKLVVIEVELLVALENLAYVEPKYRPAIGDLMDILFRKGVVEAVAFGEWSQVDSAGGRHRADKDALIKEIKASGFHLLKHRSSV